mgnify:CR=1 FL=1
MPNTVPIRPPSTAHTARTAARYGTRAERYAAIEAGAAAQNLLLQATAAGLGATLIGALAKP